MRYILDNNGYIEELIFSEGALIECGGVSCTEYTGSVPTGFASLEDWAQTENIRAWKIVDGELVKDNAREFELDERSYAEDDDNRYVTAKEIKGLLSAMESMSDVNNLFNSVDSNAESILSLGNCSSVTFDKVEIKATSNITDSRLRLIVSNENLLPNSAYSQTKNGLTFTQNYDRSITIQGTATADTEFDIAGNENSISTIFSIKSGQSYYLSGFDGEYVKFYNFDGETRTLLDSVTDGVITGDYNVTQATLYVGQGYVMDLTIYPMLNLGTSALDYVQPKQQYIDLDLAYNLTTDGLFPSSTFYPSSTTYPFNNDEIIIRNGTAMQYRRYNYQSLGNYIYINGYNPYTYIYCDKPTTVKVRYRNTNTVSESKITLEGYTSIVSHDAYSNTKIEFLPNGDLEAVMKVSVQNLADGDDAPFVEKFRIDKTGEVKLYCPMTIESGALDAINIEDAMGSAVINSDVINSI